MTKYSNYYSVRNIRNEHKKNLQKSSKIREQLSGKKKLAKIKKCCVSGYPAVCAETSPSQTFFWLLSIKKFSKLP